MIKHYCMCWVNSRTGEVEHMAVSDTPLKLDHIKPDIPDEVAVVIPGDPPVIPLTYIVHEFEVEAPTKLRGREVLDDVESFGATVRMKATANADRVMANIIPARDFNNARS